MPARNAGRTLRATLDSLLAQDYPNFEIIVSDDQSTDDTARIARSYANRGVRHFLRPRDARTGAVIGDYNWNHALSLAQGEFIALYHSDDVYHPAIVRRQIELLAKREDASCVFTLSRNVNDDGLPTGLGYQFIPPEIERGACLGFDKVFDLVLKHHNFVRIPTWLMRRRAYAEVGGFDPDRFKSSSDLDLCLRMARWGQIGFIPEKLHSYRISSRQTSAQVGAGRTEPADFFLVMDDYLSRPEVAKLASAPSLAAYEAHRALDELHCVNNLLTQARTGEAVRRLATLLRRPARLWRCQRIMGVRFSRLLAAACAQLAAHGLGAERLAARVYCELKKRHHNRLDAQGRPRPRALRRSR